MCLVPFLASSQGIALYKLCLLITRSIIFLHIFGGNGPKTKLVPKFIVRLFNPLVLVPRVYLVIGVSTGEHLIFVFPTSFGSYFNSVPFLFFFWPSCALSTCVSSSCNFYSEFPNPTSSSSFFNLNLIFLHY